ncbi:MAG: biotin--[acetyl-CoA-carboxylase] ligase [Alcaligenaceae bacterium]|nr:biotin--[acetyl-CoA-carboxylase] ligase [Alcaligenaceae bacterium]
MTLLPSAGTLQKTLFSALPDFSSLAWVEQIDSTNTFLMQEARNPQSQWGRPALIGAHHQQKGKGRSGRKWVDNAGATLMFSCAYDVFLPPAQLPMLAPVAGIVACEQLRKIVGSAARDRLSMKWPNDIQFDEGKLSGLLVESVKPGNGRVNERHHVVVVGMGMNLSQAEALSQDLGRKVADWTSVLMSLNRQDEQAEHIALLVARIARAWSEAFSLYEQEGFAPFRQRHESLDALKTCEVNVLSGDKIVLTGIARGLNDQACLVVENGQGLHLVTNGDISIRARTHT